MELPLEAVIVGVLLFTPLLLLLPTLVAFYALLTGTHIASGAVAFTRRVSAGLAILLHCVTDPRLVLQEAAGFS